MQKNRKNSEQNVSRQFTGGLNLPDVLHVDVLSTMLDEDLVVRLRTLESDLEKAYDSYADTRPWEEELAYVKREQQIRRVRRDSHLEFIKQSEFEFARLEASLPAGDFDNSAYVHAASGGRHSHRWD